MRPREEATLPDAVEAPGPARPTGLAPGIVLRDRYVLEELVAHGATAAVWRGYDKELRRTIAIKVLTVGETTREGAASRFRREAVTAARLPHPGIVAVYDTGSDDLDGDTVTWLAIEHVDGPDLLTLLRHHPRGLASTTAAAIVEQASVALGVAHERGVVHRDVKPANLLVSRDGVVKISDFGIALGTGEHIPVVTGDPVGTAAYSSPEQLHGDVPADPRIDVFALGVVLFEALTGRAAFPSSGPSHDRDRPLRPRRVRADVHRSLDAVVARATDPNPSRRHQDAAHLAAELRMTVPVEPRALAANAVDSTTADDAATTGGAGIALEPPTGRDRLRWWALVAAVLVSVATAATILVRAAPPDAEDTTIATDAGVGVSDVRIYDPYGSVDVDPGRVLQVVDGDPETVWSTPAYPRPLRTLGTPGVGVRVDLGEPVTVSSVTLAVTPGVTVEVLTRDDPPPTASTELDWELVGRSQDSSGLVVFDEADRTARHWLVWFTELRQTGDSWQASLDDVSFESADDQ